LSTLVLHKMPFQNPFRYFAGIPFFSRPGYRKNAQIKSPYLFIGGPFFGKSIEIQQFISYTIAKISQQTEFLYSLYSLPSSKISTHSLFWQTIRAQNIHFSLPAHDAFPQMIPLLYDIAYAFPGSGQRKALFSRIISVFFGIPLPLETETGPFLPGISLFRTQWQPQCCNCFPRDLWQ